VALLAELVQRAAAALPEVFDIDVLEAHHRGKQDAPSGTALALVAAARAARAGTPGIARPGGEIAVHSVRAGDLVGEHAVRFCGPGEELTLSHRAADRGLFARGALAAALWLQPRPPGRYRMADVLGFKTGT
jgi:4-hydroxy-tetrahydrodipicolinate reductase